MRLHILPVALLAALLASPVAAQSLDTAPPVPAAQMGGGTNIGFRAYGLYDYVTLSATDSFEAVFDEAKTSGLGFGIEGLRLWRGVFARFAFSRLTMDGGERVNIIESTGQVFKTGVGTEVEMTPIEFGLGWRQPLDGIDRYVAYGGFSGMRMKFTQTSEFAQTGDDLDETYNGYAIFAGFDAMVTHGVFVGAEFQYRSVPDAIGLDGDEPGVASVANYYDEHDLGGTVFRVLFGIRR